MTSAALRDRYGQPMARRALNRRVSILNALEVVLQDGTPWQRASVLEVARVAGCSAPAFYQYFADLAEAFDALMERFAAEGRGESEHMRLIAALLRYERAAVDVDA